MSVTDWAAFKAAFVVDPAARTRRIVELENEVASWTTGLALLQQEYDEIVSEDTMDEATLARATTQFELL